MSNKHELLIQAAKKMFLEKGYVRTSIEDITNEAKISKGSFYTYFKSKDDLLNDIIIKKHKTMETTLEDILKEDISFEDTLQKLLEKRILISDEDIQVEVSMINVFRNIDALRRDTIVLLRKKDQINIDAIKEILIKYADKINIELKDIKKYSSMINGIVETYRMHVLYLETDPDKDLIRDFEAIKKAINDEKNHEAIKFIKKSIIKLLV